MVFFCLLGSMGGYALTALSLYLIWGLKVQTWLLIIPLITQTLAVLLWAGIMTTSIWLALSVSRKTQAFYVYWMNSLFSGVPFGYFAWNFYVYPGARTQFVLEWLTRDCFKLLY